MLETERLTLREFELSDVEFMYELMNSPLYIKNIGDRNINSIEDARSFLVSKIISSYKKNGYGLYAVVLKESNQVIGMSGLVRRDNLPSTDIGFGFLPEFMGKGYAYEASERVMKYAKNKLALNPILAITIKENERSIKLLNKLGLLYESVINWEGEEILLLSNSPQ
ncbi:GNAT family N-acetyltransferase [Endozoicomonas sp. 8E]|uniref:GNAT family N-acetyltransferase n=1 Tax=Endozoicomonas sp. 8E TaxID=3035692 RepID=UPI002938D59A|nr:GNAT family N-acetyltransferase [Endozoicomonas sp. 8E]WOG30126.1 GNAT family N-acetyltransferase [Endozoicomonas sp. 8E]